ncbi:MAG: CDP-alcohol phosphatidyltransferase family protein [Monoglobaceae bacterium]
MIGYYNYTVLLTYLSLLSSASGILVALNGSGHPYLGVFFLLACGLCDAFDGKVARTKENRTVQENSFGIQIDSLSDLVAFGVLPVCIGMALVRRSPYFSSVIFCKTAGAPFVVLSIVFGAVMLFYILAAMIRLAYYNVTEEERQETEGGVRRMYLGLPVTTSSLIFPAILLLQYLIRADITVVYFAVMLITAFAFLSKFHIRKPGMRGLLALVGIGALEFIAILIIHYFIRK